MSTVRTVFYFFILFLLMNSLCAINVLSWLCSFVWLSSCCLINPIHPSVCLLAFWPFWPQPVHLSVSLSACILSVRPHCFLTSLFFCGLFARCLWRLAYAVFPSLCQCFSSCQSFSLSVSPFVPFLFFKSSPIHAYVYVCVCVHENAWAISNGVLTYHRVHVCHDCMSDA